MAFSSSRSRPALITGALIALGCFTVPAHATDYWTPKALLGEFFKGSKKVAPKRVTLNEADATDIARKLGTEPSKLKRTWSIYVGEADDKRTGYAMLDAEIGLHDLMDIGVRFDDKGRVERMEIMAFREPYGDGVRADRFRNQFVGKGPGDAIVAGRDIDIVSGATLSSRAAAVMVKRDALVLQAALKNGL